MNFRTEFELAEGRVVIQALPVPLIEQTAELLARSFVSSSSSFAPYAQYVRRNISRYLKEHQALPPKAVVLVAVLQPTASLEAEPEEEEPAPPPGSAALSGRRLRVIGAAEVSFCRSTRSSQAFLDAPERCSYLCNMAVSPVFRRRGVASRLLGAAEELASGVMREREMFLHLRFIDQEAAKLYESAGFLPRAQHWPVIALLRIQRMKLMRKSIAK